VQLQHTLKKITDINALVTCTAILFLFLLLPYQNTEAQRNESKPENLQEVGIEEQLGNTIPGDITLTNSNGKRITTGEIFNDDKPVIINPVYYECPMLCSMVLNGVLEGAKSLAWSPGKEYTIITFSIDPSEGTELARSNKKNYIKNLNKKKAEEGWYFLTADSTNIKRLADAIGFIFEYDEARDQYAHSAGIAFASPERKITRYLYGIEYNTLNLRNALYDSSDGTIGSAIDKVVMYCYQYDPTSRSYTPVAWNIMKLGGLATFLFLTIFLGLFWLKERRKQSPKITA